MVVGTACENDVLRPRILVGVKVTLVVSVALSASKKISCTPGWGVSVWALAKMIGLELMSVDLRAVTATTSRLGLVERMSRNSVWPNLTIGICVAMGTMWVTVMKSGTSFCEDCNSVSS